MKNFWWCAAALSIGVFGCSDSGGKGNASNSSNGPRAVSSAPTRGDGSSSVEDSASRTGRGVVTLLGATNSIPPSVWSFAGPASGADKGQDEVSCSLGTLAGRLALAVSAGRVGVEAPGAQALLALDALAPSNRDIVFVPGLDSQELQLQVAITPEGDVSIFRYQYGADTHAGSGKAAPSGAISSCSVSISAASERWITGQVACRNLFATPNSADAPAAGSAAPRANMTVAFDCPIDADSGTTTKGDGSGGKPSGSGGSGGSDVTTPKSCHGSPLPCSLRSEADCLRGDGCSVSGDCTGLADDCLGYFEASSCYAQDGCYWSSVSRECLGSRSSCDTFLGSASCTSQDGCSWKNTCEGVALPCTGLGEATCDAQPGCVWY